MVQRIVSERLIDPGNPSMIGNSIIVSPDCRRVAYVARAGKNNVAVVDGKEQKQYDKIEKGSPVFSPDSQRVAYVARADGKQFVVVDGQEGNPYHPKWGEGTGISGLVFSPDSQRVAYVARADGKQFVVVDGQEQLQYKSVGSPVFSPDSQRLAYIAHHGGRLHSGVCVILDGQEQLQYKSVGSPVFSPDSQRVAYVARPDGKQFVVVDGQEGNPYHPKWGEGTGISGLVFSPDSQRVAYWVQNDIIDEGGGKSEGFVVVDGQEGELYEYRVPQEGPPVFSPDSQRVAYVAKRGKWFVVVDGQAGKRHTRIEERSLVFSTDSRRVAYVALVPARRWGFIKLGQRSLVVIDGQEGSRYDSIVAPRESGGIIFDLPNQLYYIARKGHAFYLVEERLT